MFTGLFFFAIRKRHGSRHSRDFTTWHLPLSILATEKAWKVGFKGGSAELFRKCLDDMNKGRGGKLYANFVSIIQSSGMGKSRLVDEIAKLIFTIPFCFRSESNG